VSFEPELNWALAAHWWGIAWDEFTRKTGLEQSYLIAVYESSSQIESVLAEAAAKSTQ